jgi:two-component system cell cycle response regulator DivK
MFPAMTRLLPPHAAPRWDQLARRLGSGPRRLPDTGTRERPRVLIVEDHEDTLEMYAWCMRAAGWLVWAVTDGEQALSIASQIVPDVIVMDLRLPVIDGLDATRLLKANPATKHIPVVGCSGVVGGADALAKEAGCDEFVAKPCPPEDLRELLEDVVTKRGGPDEPS